MKLDNKKKLVLVSGGSNGIGRDIINKFLEKGFMVINASRRLNKRKNKNEIKFLFDFSKKNQINKLISSLKKKKIISRYNCE